MLNLIVRFLGIGGEDVLTWVCQAVIARQAHDNFAGNNDEI